MEHRFLLLVLFVISANDVTTSRVFNHQLYADVLDPEQCQDQLVLLTNDNLKYQFLDASFRIPSGLKTGNINDLGDYHQCLAIDQIVGTMQIQGKYCAITVPLDQDPIDLPTFPEWNITWPEIPGTDAEDDEGRSVMVVDKNLPRLTAWAQELAGLRQEPTVSDKHRIFPMVVTSTQGMTLAVCIPKVCSPTQAINFFQQTTGVLSVTFNEFYCRLPDDKPLKTVDFVAIAIFSFIGLLIGMSTAYDLTQIFYYKIESSEVSALYRSFSLYTNTRRLLTFNSAPGALECVDGIRAISMLWVVIGHTYSFTLLAYIHNLMDILEWMTSFSSTWINASPITVDTFFMLSGVLVVYTTVGKITRGRFVRSLHLFYLNRFLRMFPLLAAAVLFQASVINHVSDGPFWQNIAVSSENCRSYWWTVLLHVQNYVNPMKICLQQTWYLSVDMQLYYLSPLVLFWLWGRSHVAWFALITALLLSLVSSSIISFLNNFSAALANFSRITEFNDYLKVYYINTLSRAPPFFVGLLYGYMLTVYRDKKIRFSRVNAFILWLLSFLMMAFCIFSMYPVMQNDHSNQTFDNFLNAYMRAIWAAALGWVIFACAKGYGGPINWFLSLKLWKLPARLSYAVYLIHVSIILISRGSWTKTHYFTPADSFYQFGADVLFSFAAAFVLCVCIDAPCSTLQKLLFGGGRRRPQKPRLEAQNANVHVIETDTHIMKTAL